MTRIVYVNGDYMPEDEAKISIFDRGFLLADSVYEVTSVLEGKLIDFHGHAARLARSLKELEMASPCSEEELLAIHRDLVARNGIDIGMVYVQVTRGNTGDREFNYTPEGTPPTLVVFTKPRPGLADELTGDSGFRVISVPDLRWGRRDIKTTQLLYPLMAKMAARAANVDDAWFVDDGTVTEGTACNTYIVKGNSIITRNLGHAILPGVTRTAVIRMARELQLQIVERPFTIEEAQRADEAFVSSASVFVTPVIEVDGVAVGNGKAGPIALRLREFYLDEMRRNAI